MECKNTNKLEKELEAVKRTLIAQEVAIKQIGKDVMELGKIVSGIEYRI